MEKINISSIVGLFAIIIILAGIAGMLYCLPFLYSYKVEDLIGAGLPFVAGAILISGGLISLAILMKRKDSI